MFLIYTARYKMHLLEEEICELSLGEYKGVLTAITMWSRSCGELSSTFMAYEGSDIARPDVILLCHLLQIQGQRRFCSHGMGFAF